MDSKTYNKFKKLLIAGCDNHIKSGKKIRSGGFFGSDGSLCPIGTIIVERNVPVNYETDYFDRLNKKLGKVVPEIQYWDFISGFDGHIVSSIKAEKSLLFRLGRKLRKKYLGK